MVVCNHPLDQRGKAILNADDPDMAYCRACRSVLILEGDVWVAQPTGITKATYRSR